MEDSALFRDTQQHLRDWSPQDLLPLIPKHKGRKRLRGSSPRVGDDVREWFRPSTRRPVVEDSWTNLRPPSAPSGMRLVVERDVPVVVDGIRQTSLQRWEATLERQPAKAQAYRLRRAGAGAPPPRSINPRVVNSRGRRVDGTRRPDTPIESVADHGDGFRLPSAPSSPIGEMALAIRSPGPSQARSQAPAFSSPALPPASPAIGAPPILRAESLIYKSPSPKEVIPKLGRPRIESPSPFDIQNYEGDWPDEMFTISIHRPANTSPVTLLDNMPHHTCCVFGRLQDSAKRPWLFAHGYRCPVGRRIRQATILIEDTPSPRPPSPSPRPPSRSPPIVIRDTPSSRPRSPSPRDSSPNDRVFRGRRVRDWSPQDLLPLIPEHKGGKRLPGSSPDEMSRERRRLGVTSWPDTSLRSSGCRLG
ncbi:hypothetical protein B0T24DRAFT_723906 [Lasiosphaeria ovina]|uniref:Uncharacterized protein n=1 Tax=Lasiosphaeria ovina TaxID=92902 RepID=A0AAE0MZQ7_9PEZI|nr:hypothetical protein B0T24DRAFT_723906 [Lasiosphaeria ovina]